MNKHVTRRRFLGASTGTALGLGVVAAWPVPGLAKNVGSADKLNLAVIGVAHRGGANLKGVAGENIVALCDVDEKYLAEAGERFPQAQRFVDFRKMFDAMAKQIDGVVVSTPDHTHAIPSVMAMRMGKHCYCEKPLTQSVYEARLVTDTAKAQRVVTQIGTQIHAGKNYRRVVELVQANVIGPIGEVHVWSAAKYFKGDRPSDTPPVPEGLHWDLWLGPAPERTYHPSYAPKTWRCWWEYGNGALGDFGCHYMDLPFWALKLQYPTSIEADGPRPVHPDSCPEWLVVRYHYPARENLPPVLLTWYDSGKRPELLGQLLPEKEAGKWNSGVLFVGTKGMILANYTQHKLLPEDTFTGFQPPEPTIPDSVGHHQEWIDAIKHGGSPTCRFDYSGPLTEAALLGGVAYRAGEKLSWDGPAAKVTNTTKAEPFLRRPYRPGWTLEG